MHTQGYVADVGEALDSALVLLAPRIHGLGQSSSAHCALVCPPAFITARAVPGLIKTSTCATASIHIDSRLTGLSTKLMLGLERGLPAVTTPHGTTGLNPQPQTPNPQPQTRNPPCQQQKTSLSGPPSPHPATLPPSFSSLFLQAFRFFASFSLLLCVCLAVSH